ncbi:MAG: succinate dehydrogenase assembly factor 2 [Rhodospirillaceae bacterium]
MADQLETQRRKLLFRSVRRGTKESDMVIGGFAEAHIGDLDGGQLDRFEALLDENDQDVLAWVIGMKPAPAAFDSDVLDMIRNFKKSLQSFD